MTAIQDEYCEVLIKCYSTKPLESRGLTGNKFRDKMAEIAKHPAFEIFIFIIIVCNTIVLAFSWYGMDQKIIDALWVLNFIFTIIYTVEMFVKLIAFGKRYFADGWNVFDFSIVMSAWLGILLF